MFYGPTLILIRLSGDVLTPRGISLSIVDIEVAVAWLLHHILDESGQA